MKNIKIGYAMCGSFCTIEKSLIQLKKLVDLSADIMPIFSETVYNTDTRFTMADKLIENVEQLTNKKIIHSVKGTEPIGPKNLLDLLIICPCTGNTISKIANGITDSSVTMAAKAHLRNNKPVLLAIATNDALSRSAENIGKLLNTKNIYFVPFGQDDAIKKPTSMICDFEKLIPAAQFALAGKQMQPIIIG